VSAYFARTLERENADLLEKLTAAIRDKNAAQIAAVNAEQDAIAAEDKLAALSATGATDLDEFVRVARTFSDEHYQNALVAELRRVYHAQEETVIGNARYEYLRKLNPREFAALYDEALADERFDDLVDRYRMKGEPVGHGYDRAASLAEGRYVCTCGTCSCPDAGEKP
jgi:hypothetical protein